MSIFYCDCFVQLTSAVGHNIVRAIRLEQTTERKSTFRASAFVYLDSEIFLSQQSDTLQLNSANELLKNLITTRLGGFSEHVSLVGELWFEDWFVQAHGVCILSTASIMASTGRVLIALLFVFALHESISICKCCAQNGPKFAHFTI
ncbi:hypothetical protein PHET_02366 [Paragonimus heterotremus]|uniref:Uncharacterized protein n=1 Tax=Paragonimus heterotremus TaxID=100268 RepID=A0A8J4T4B2_9TREM|nr:hypothetical protein PHET_02366 [Paragonimus heterotremus]